MELVCKKEKTLFTILAVLASLAWVVLLGVTLGTIIIYLLIGFLFYLFAQSALISYLKGNTVVISSTQFPDLNERIKLCAEKLNVPEPSQAFLLHGNGLFNAFATRFLGKDYIALYSDVVDALDEHPDAIDFYIGHELGHVKRKHIIWSTFLMPVKWLPLLGAAYMRACETTCDRHGLFCCKTPNDARLGMSALAAGAKRWKTLEQLEFAEQSQKETGFWMSFHELCSDYPWLTKRMSAIVQLSENKEPKLPKRNFLAYVLAFFVPRTGVPGGGIIVIAMIGVLAAIAIPQYQKYVERAKLAAEMSKMQEYQVSPQNEGLIEEENAADLQLNQQ